MDAEKISTSWTDPDSGTVYDLTRRHVDRDDDTWAPTGWFYPFDGTPVPVATCYDYGTPEMSDVPLPTVISQYGPRRARGPAKAGA